MFVSYNSFPDPVATTLFTAGQMLKRIKEATTPLACLEADQPEDQGVFVGRGRGDEPDSDVT
jgi:hypothetical protein